MVGESPLIMRLNIPRNGHNNYGADLQWISAFPAEEEICYPPLTFLRPTNRKEKYMVGGIEFTVVEVVPSLNVSI